MSDSDVRSRIEVRWLADTGDDTSYESVVAAMERYTNQRNDETPDQLWLLEHPPVFTQGTSCDDQPRQNPASIPVIKSNRGGQITWHGPGQLILYLLLDLKRLGIGAKSLVHALEQAMIDLLGSYDLDANRKTGAPGIYVGGAKLGALGLRIRRARTFHGLSLNVDPDLEAFDWIDPCGYPGQRVSSLQQLGIEKSVREVGEDLLGFVAAALNVQIGQE